MTHENTYRDDTITTSIKKNKKKIKKIYKISSLFQISSKILNIVTKNCYSKIQNRINTKQNQNQIQIKVKNQ
jgi:hypothetical protein